MKRENILLAILIAGSAYLIYNQYALNKRFKNKVSAIEQERYLSERKFSILKSFSANTVALQTTCSGDQIPDLKLENVYTGEKTSLKKISGTAHTLIISVSQRHCQECIRHEIDVLKNYTARIGKEHIIILIQAIDHGYISFFKKQYAADAGMYEIGEQTINPTLDGMNTPYIMLSNNQQVESAIVPDKMYTELTNSFYEAAAKKFGAPTQND